GDLSEQGEADAREDVGASRTAASEDGLASAPHVRRVRVVTDELECVIRLDGRGDVHVAPVKQGPAAVFRLSGADVLSDATLFLRVDFVEVVTEEDVLRGDRRVRLQLEHPMAIFALASAQGLHRGADLVVEVQPIGRFGSLLDALVVISAVVRHLQNHLSLETNRLVPWSRGGRTLLD